jgi:hypothetical protein
MLQGYVYGYGYEARPVPNMVQGPFRLGSKETPFNGDDAGIEA